jgi:H+/Cl- antiporter ClcA
MVVECCHAGRASGLAALVVTLLAGVLVIGEITDGAIRRW